MNIKDIVRNGLPIKNCRVIDAHGHIGPFFSFFIPETSPESLINSMDRMGIEKCCISSTLAIGSDFKTGNDMTYNACKSFPDRFIGYAVPNPYYIDESMEDIKDRLATPFFKGIKIHPQFHEYSVNGKNYHKVYEYADDNNLLILSHTWGSAKDLTSLHNEYRNIKFLVAHCGAGIPDNFLTAVQELDRTYLDLSSSCVYLGEIERLVSAVGAKRITFSTDMAYLEPAAQLGRVAFANIPEEDKILILGQNISQLLNI